MQVLEPLLRQRSVSIPVYLPVQFPQVAQVERLSCYHFFHLRIVLVAFSMLAQLLRGRIWEDFTLWTDDHGNLLIEQTRQDAVLVFEKSPVLLVGHLVLLF